MVAGPAAMMASVLTWGLLATVGWTLLFCASTSAVVATGSEVPALVWQRFYFVGSTLVTLGLGDFHPGGREWHLLTVMASGYGYFLITLSVAYLLPVVTAVVQGRQLALQVSYLSSSAENLVQSSWDGIGFDTLSQQLMALTPLVIQSSQNYLAYPVLRHFHQREPEASLSLHLAHLDRALFLLEHGVAEGHRPPRLVTTPLRRAIGSLARLELGDTALPGQALLPPLLQTLLEVDIPSVEPAVYHHSAASDLPRRRLLLALVLDDGWGLKDLFPQPPSIQDRPVSP